MNRLASKVAMVTGAGRGIGAAIALAFVREGASVALAELDIDTARATAERIAAETGSKQIVAVHTDVTQSASVKDAVTETEARFGPLDVLVNNAGINVFCDPLTMTDDDWKRCFAVDLDGVWNGCHAVLPGMVERERGSIVNIASTHSFKIIPGCFPYPVAKHGVIGLTRALGIEYAPNNVRVNAIAPGYIETQLDARLVGFASRPASRAAGHARFAADEAHRPAAGSGDDGGVPRVRRGAVHQRELHHRGWRKKRALPRLRNVALAAAHQD